jgi:hypothetical protein
MKVLKVIFSIFLMLTAIIFAFLFAGVFGAIIFGILVTTALKIPPRKKELKVLNIASLCLIFSIVGYLLMMAFGLVHADKILHEKLAGIRQELINDGYRPKWFIISQKRYSFFNNLLLNSVKNGNSKHLVGKAIDIFVLDVNNDGKFNKTDYELIKKASLKYELKNPESKGAMINYFGKGFLSQHMVHIEIY